MNEDWFVREKKIFTLIKKYYLCDHCPWVWMHDCRRRVF